MRDVCGRSASFLRTSGRNSQLFFPAGVDPAAGTDPRRARRPRSALGMPRLTLEQRQRWWRESLGAPRFVMAPMVLQGELAYRLLARRHGCELCYSPMLPASAFLASAVATDPENPDTGRPCHAGRLVHLAGRCPRQAVARAAGRLGSGRAGRRGAAGAAPLRRDRHQPRLPAALRRAGRLRRLPPRAGRSACASSSQAWWPRSRCQSRARCASCPRWRTPWPSLSCCRRAGRRGGWRCTAGGASSGTTRARLIGIRSRRSGGRWPSPSSQTATCARAPTRSGRWPRRGAPP